MLLRLLVLKWKKVLKYINLYQPIISKNIDDGITIYITEDSELEKGITDTIANNFNSIILKIMYDYLIWISDNENQVNNTNEENDELKFKTIHGDFISPINVVKYEFLKYGYDTIPTELNINGTLNCIKELLISNDTYSNSRKNCKLGRKLIEKQIDEENVDGELSEPDSNSSDELPKKEKKKSFFDLFRKKDKKQSKTKKENDGISSSSSNDGNDELTVDTPNGEEKEVESEDSPSDSINNENDSSTQEIE